jgi:hypothetical protein
MNYSLAMTDWLIRDANFRRRAPPRLLLLSALSSPL